MGARDRPALRAWQGRPSPLARYALFAYTLIVVDASLYPFTGWRDLGIGPFDYLAAGWPARPYPFDLVVNAVGYAPLGLLGGFALHPRLRGLALAVAATAYAALVSSSMEALQTYLPARVASSADLASNVAGAALGALAAARFAHPLLDTGRLRAWRARWFSADASRGLVLVVVWLGALVYPEVPMLGMGGLVKAFAPDFAADLADAAGFAPVPDPTAAALRFADVEAAVFALGLVGSGLLLASLVRATAARELRLVLVAALAVLALVVKSAAQSFVFGDVEATPWFVPGGRSGLLAGTGALLALTFLPARARWALALAALVAVVVLTNLSADNPYANAIATSLTRGRLMNFYGLARGLSLAWPFFAIVYLLRHRDDGPRWRRSKDARPGSI